VEYRGLGVQSHADDRARRRRAPEQRQAAESGRATQRQAGSAAVVSFVQRVITASGLVVLQRQTGNTAVTSFIQREPEVDIGARHRKDLAKIQAMWMKVLLKELEDLHDKVKTDYDAGRAVGGARLVLAMKAVAAKGNKQPWNTFITENSFKMDDGPKASPLPEDQLIDIVAYLGGPRDYSAELLLPQWPEKFTGPAGLPTDMRVRVAQQALDNRAAVPIRPELTTRDRGFQYAGDSGAFKTASPTVPKLERIARNEILHEGGPTAINTYDSNKPPLTLGAGWLQGNAITWISTWLGGDQASREKFRSVGLDIGDGRIRALQADGSVVEDKAAMGVFAADPHLLSLFMNAGEDPAAKPKVMNAQLALLRDTHLNAAARDAETTGWSDAAIAVCMHIQHWLPAFGWGTHKTDYLATNGDLLAIVKTFGRLAGVVREKGARIVGNGENNCTTPFSNSHFDVFGAGAGQRGAGQIAAMGAGSTVTFSLDDIEKSEGNKDQLLFRLGPPTKTHQEKVDWLRLPQR
jgi:hypothetical protein